jgi:hypothetical protein
MAFWAVIWVVGALHSLLIVPYDAALPPLKRSFAQLSVPA